jgi:hypothetical protein
MFKKISTMGWLAIASAVAIVVYFRKPIIAWFKKLIGK